MSPAVPWPTASRGPAGNAHALRRCFDQAQGCLAHMQIWDRELQIEYDMWILECSFAWDRARLLWLSAGKCWLEAFRLGAIRAT
eukprot:3680581-Alexandrium_andersonii.AAC.1